MELHNLIIFTRKQIKCRIQSSFSTLHGIPRYEFPSSTQPISDYRTLFVYYRKQQQNQYPWTYIIFYFGGTSSIFSLSSNSQKQRVNQRSKAFFILLSFFFHCYKNLVNSQLIKNILKMARGNFLSFLGVFFQAGFFIYPLPSTCCLLSCL